MIHGRHALAALLVAVSTVVGTAAAHADEAECLAANEKQVTLRKQFKLKEALKELAKCAASACPGEVAEECSRRIVQVNAAMPTIVLGATDAAGNDLTAVTVTLDGAPLVARLDGHPIALDPGSHALRFEGGGNTVDKTLVVAEGVKDRHISVVLGPTTAAAAPPPPVPAVVVEPPPVAPETEDQKAHTIRAVSYVLGGTGAAALVVGSIFGGIAIAGVSNAKGECTPNCGANTNPAAHNDMQSATTDATVSTAMLVAGGVLVATGLTMFVTARRTRAGTAFQWTPTMGVHGGGLALGGSF